MTSTPTHDEDDLRKLVTNRMALLQVEDHHINGISAADEARIEHYVGEVMNAVEAREKLIREQAEKAYGGCHNCYGKGYATQSSRASGRGVSWDTSGIKYCDCARGKQLEAVFNSSKTKLNKEG